MKIYPPLSLAFLIPTASAWTTPSQHASPIRSIALQQKLPTLLRSTPVKDAIEEEVVINGDAPKPSEKEFGVVSSDKLNELYDLVVIGGVSSFLVYWVLQLYTYTFSCIVNIHMYHINLCIYRVQPVLLELSRPHRWDVVQS